MQKKGEVNQSKELLKHKNQKSVSEEVKEEAQEEAQEKKPNVSFSAKQRRALSNFFSYKSWCSFTWCPFFLNEGAFDLPSASFPSSLPSFPA